MWISWFSLFYVKICLCMGIKITFASVCLHWCAGACCGKNWNNYLHVCLTDLFLIRAQFDWHMRPYNLTSRSPVLVPNEDPTGQTVRHQKQNSEILCTKDFFTTKFASPHADWFVYHAVILYSTLRTYVSLIDKTNQNLGMVSILQEWISTISLMQWHWLNSYD